MIAFPGMLLAAAEQAGMKCPPDPNDFDAAEFPHFRVFCSIQLGSYPGEHWENAKVVAAVPDDQILTVTVAGLINRGFV